MNTTWKKFRNMFPQISGPKLREFIKKAQQLDTKRKLLARDAQSIAAQLRALDNQRNKLTLAYEEERQIQNRMHPISIIPVPSTALRRRTTAQALAEACVPTYGTLRQQAQQARRAHERAEQLQQQSNSIPLNRQRLQALLLVPDVEPANVIDWQDVLKHW